MAKVRALIRPAAIALPWLLAGVWIASRAWSHTSPAEPSRQLLVPLSPSTWKHTGATHVALITGSGLWCALPDRDGGVRRALRIHERWTQFPGQQAWYPRVVRIELVKTAAVLSWFGQLEGATPKGAIVAAIDYGADDHGEFEIAVGDRTLRVAGNPSFAAKVPPGVLANILPPTFHDDLRPWCEIANDLHHVSRGHQTFHTLLATQFGNAVGALCCMSDTTQCRARD